MAGDTREAQARRRLSLLCFVALRGVSFLLGKRAGGSPGAPINRAGQSSTWRSVAVQSDGVTNLVAPRPEYGVQRCAFAALSLNNWLRVPNT